MHFNVWVATLLWVLMQATITQAQRPPLPDNYFIRLEQNNITLYGPNDLNGFFEPLHKLINQKKGKVRILHLGDSHIQADFFSGRMRENFFTDSLIPNSGRGFIFPYPMARTNSSYSYNVSYAGSWDGCRCIKKDRDCDWGMACITTITQDPTATFAVTLNSEATPVNLIRVFYNAYYNTAFDVALLPDSGVNIISQTTYRHLGYKEFLLSQPVNSASFAIKQNNPKQYRLELQGIWLANQKPGLTYSALGVNGAEVGSFLRCRHLAKQLKVFDPQLVIISLGTNDAYPKYFSRSQFKNNMGLLLQQITAAAPNAAILLTTPGDNYRYRKYYNYNNYQASRALHEIAQETGCAVWDYYTIMGGLKSIYKWYNHGLARYDRLHYTAKGYKIQGDLLYNALLDAYQKFENNKTKPADTP